MQYKLEETKIITSVAQKATLKGFRWDPANTPIIYKIMFTSIARFLKDQKKQSEPTAVLVKSGNKTIFGAIAEYFKGETDEDPGNWSLVFTIDAEKLEAIRNSYELTSSAFQSVFNIVSVSNFYVNFPEYSWAHDMMIYCVDSLIDWLKSNVAEGEETTITLDGFFEATSAVENGEVEIAVVPDGAIKKLIKDDLSIQK